MEKKIEFSNYQKAVFNEILNGTHNIIVNAVAGSGKTFVIEHAVKMLGLTPKDVRCIAFNFSTAKKLTEKVGSFASAKTIHSHGFEVLKGIFRNLKVDEHKVKNALKGSIYSLSSEISIDTPKADVNVAIGNCCKLFDLCRVNLIQSGNISEIRNLMNEHNIEAMFDEDKVVSKMLETAYVMPSNGIIDYTDMIVLPLSYRKHIKPFRYVFVDECQDLNTAQRELMYETAKGGRFIAVGDPKQAINGFAGADCQSFEKIAALPNTIEMPLSVNYRCGKKMIALAKELVPQIEAHEGAIDGVVETINKLDRNTFKPNDMVLCRTSAPLVAMCLKLIQANITAVVKGGDIRETLLRLVDKAKTSSIDALLKYLTKEQDKLVRVIMREQNCNEEDARNSGRYVSFVDRCNCIQNIAMYTASVSGIKDYIFRLFDERNTRNAVVFSTCHKAKGLEADRVLILLPYKLPLVWKTQLDWQYEQELNLKYVAVTRAKKELIFVNIEERELSAVML